MVSGQTPDEALDACTSAQAPVMRLTTGGLVHVGDVVVDDAADLAALACVTKIEGSLTVTATAPFTFSLPSLQIRGNTNLSVLTSGGSSKISLSASAPLTIVAGQGALEMEIRVAGIEIHYTREATW